MNSDVSDVIFQTSANADVSFQISADAYVDADVNFIMDDPQMRMRMLRIGIS